MKQIRRLVSTTLVALLTAGSTLPAGAITAKNLARVTVNGAEVGASQSIPSGSLIATPAGKATIDLGDAGRIEMGDDAAITLTYDDTGQVLVELGKGCVVVIRQTSLLPASHTVLKGPSAGADAERTSESKETLGGCLKNGALVNLSKGAVVAGGLAGAAAGSGGLLGLGVAGTTLTAVGLTAAGVAIAVNTSGNASPSR